MLTVLAASLMCLLVLNILCLDAIISERSTERRGETCEISVLVSFKVVLKLRPIFLEFRVDFEVIILTV